MAKKVEDKKEKTVLCQEGGEVVVQKEPVEVVKIGKIGFRLPYSYLLPPVGAVKFEELCDDIAARGILVRIIVDEGYNVLDGEHRLRAAAKNKLTTIPLDMRPGLTEQEKIQLALDLNLHRRHLSPEQMKDLMVRLRQEGRSLRQIGEKLGVSHRTVQRKLAATGSEDTVAMPETTIGRDNKRRRAKAKPKQGPSITINSLGELDKAVKACETAGADHLPGKSIDLRRLVRIANEKQAQDRRQQDYEDLKSGDVELLLGDFRERGKDIADASVHMIMTDPPYAKEFLSLWEDLARFAARVLVPGGVLVSYSGALYLPQIHQRLGNHLEYVWEAAILHTGGKKLVSNVKVQQAWKPVLIYCQPPRRVYWKPFTDMVSGGQSKSNHEWEQAVGEAAHYIKALCPRNGVLLDPMMGSGTSLIAGLGLGAGLKCIGIEIDKAAYATSEERVKQTLADLA